MVSKNIKNFAKAIKNDDPDKTEKLIDKIIEEKEEDRWEKDVEELSGLGPERVEKVKEHGYESIEDIAKASPEDLAEVPKIGEKSAQSILGSAYEEIESTLLELSGVGPDRAEEIRKHGFCSVESIANSTLEDLMEVHKVGEESAKKVLDSAEEIWDQEERIEGYRRALEGAVKSLRSDRVLTYSRKIADDRYSEDKIEDLKKEMEGRASHEFRPSDERGYCEAWADIFEALS